ncbi:MAG: cyclodeaminase/cyclohydrolase family protein [bacterium]
MVERAKASKLAYLPVASFIQHTASRAPTPGGGAVAALNGSLGAALLLMVCRLTVGKKKYQAVEAAMRERAEALMPLRDRLKELVDSDAEAFDRVMDAYGLPAGSDAEQAARKGAIAEAYSEATRVPLEVMRLCLDGLERGQDIAADGSENALSDAAVAGLTLHTGFHGAAYNVRINLAELAPGTLRGEAEQALAQWPTRADVLVATLRATIDKRMGE